MEEVKVEGKLEMKLTNEYYLERNKGGWALNFESSIIVKKRIKGEVRDFRESWVKYYGTLYQALKGFVTAYYEQSKSLEEIPIRVQEAVSKIEEAIHSMNSVDQALVEKYKTVKVSPN